MRAGPRSRRSHRCVARSYSRWRASTPPSSGPHETVDSNGDPVLSQEISNTSGDVVLFRWRHARIGNRLLLATRRGTSRRREHSADPAAEVCACQCLLDPASYLSATPRSSLLPIRGAWRAWNQTFGVAQRCWRSDPARTPARQRRTDSPQDTHSRRRPMA